jgi:hypothetical protein
MPVTAAWDVTGFTFDEWPKQAKCRPSADIYLRNVLFQQFRIGTIHR